MSEVTKMVSRLKKQAKERGIPFEGFKECRVCKECKLLQDFKPYAKSDDGRGYICRDCSAKKPKVKREYKIPEDCAPYEDYIKKYSKYQWWIAVQVARERLEKVYYTSEYIENEDDSLIEEIAQKYTRESFDEAFHSLKSVHDAYRDGCQKWRYQIDEVYRNSRKIRSTLKHAIKSKRWKKDSKTQDIIGCSYEELTQHLRETWKQNYGTEYNREEVHIDHIIPISTATTYEELKKLNHWTNLQYLKPEDNLSKSDSLDWSLD